MDTDQLTRVRSGQGFIAALDQSGGSTPEMLAAYGVPSTTYSGEDEMFELVHRMRTRIVRSSAFDPQRVLGAILFRNTVERTVDGIGSAQYLWKIKRIVPFLKIDVGLEPEVKGTQLMRPIPDLEEVLAEAKALGIFGTKMRSFIKRADHAGIDDVVSQQFELARRILSADLIPIIEPEIDVHSEEKIDAEAVLRSAILEALANLPSGTQVLLKLSLPEEADFYRDLVQSPGVMRVLALSGGYSQEEAVRRLTANHGVIASFSRAFLAGLSTTETQGEFDSTLRQSVDEIFRASLT